MNLLRVGNRVLNLDNVAVVHLNYPVGVTPAEGATVRVFFNAADKAALAWTEFAGEEAEALRGMFEAGSLTAEAAAEQLRR